MHTDAALRFLLRLLIFEEKVQKQDGPSVGALGGLVNTYNRRYQHFDVEDPTGENRKWYLLVVARVAAALTHCARALAIACMVCPR